MTNMTGKERILRFAKREPVDLMPWFSVMGMVMPQIEKAGCWFYGNSEDCLCFIISEKKWKSGSEAVILDIITKLGRLLNRCSPAAT